MPTPGHEDIPSQGRSAPSALPLLAQIALIALAYAASGWVGHQVVVATGYASPLWPAAGVAVAGLIAWGLRCWPGICVGGLATLLWITPIDAGPALAVVIAIGMSLQALAGAWLARRYLKHRTSYAADRRLAALLLLAGPLACAISPTIGLVALLAAQAIEPSAVPLEWLTWWAGDTIGVLLFAPLALALWPGATPLRDHWEGGWRIAVTPAVTAALLVGGFLQMSRLEDGRLQAERERDVIAVTDRAQADLASAVEPLDGVVRFFLASESVTRAEFGRFAAGLVDHPALAGVDWAPRVTHAQRPGYEQVAREQGLAGYLVLEPTANTRLQAAQVRDEYFPVLYSVPLADDAGVLGLDHAYSPERREAMRRAREQDGPVHVVPREPLGRSASSMLLMLPVTQPDPIGAHPPALQGYVVGVLDRDGLLSPIVEHARSLGFGLHVRDLATQHALYSFGDTLPTDVAASEKRRIAAGSLEWELTLTPLPGLDESPLGGPLPIYLAFSVLASLLVAFAVLGSAGRNAATSARVTARTAELADALTEMRRRDDEQRAVLDNLVECVITIDTDGVVQNINRAVVSMFGYTPDEVVGSNVAMLMPAHEATAHDDHIRRYLQTGERRIIGRNREVVGRHKDGHEIALELAVSEYVFGQRRMFTGTLRDISERKALVADLVRAREDADEANRAKSAFLAAMSHEIRTPMNGVVGLVDVLARSDLTEYQRDLVRTVRESSTTLLTLIDDILDFSKIEAGRLELEHHALHVAELVEGVCASLSPLAVRRDVDVSLYISPRLPEYVVCDELRLRQVLYNIVGNAIKFSAGRPGIRGRVAVRVEARGEHPLRVAFTVTDNGIGIQAERLHDLFRPFTQAENSTTRRYGGTGLGLAICRRLVDMLDGEIEVDSAPGDGSTFTVVLPMTPDMTDARTTMPALAGVACVVLPCCGDDRAAIVDYLRSAGARLATPDDARAAQEAVAAATGPAVIIECVRADAEPSMRLDGLDLRSVRIVRGRPSSRRHGDDGESIAIDGNVLRRAALLRAVAIAAGRASPEDTLYVEDENERMMRTEPPSIETARAQGRLILVAEDNEINQKVILHQLALLGFAAEVANDGREALKLWRHGRHALVLTDLHMPVMDGYALARAIREADTPQSHTPVLALTANALRGEERRAMDAGMDAYLTKPVQLEHLRVTLEAHLPSVTDAAAIAAAIAPEGEATPAPADPDRTQPVFDVSVLEELVGDDVEIVCEFLVDFRRSAADLGRELADASARGEIDATGNAAHKLKSAARSVGALALGELAAVIEREARGGADADLPERVERLNTLLAETDGHIATWLGSR